MANAPQVRTYYVAQGVLRRELAEQGDAFSDAPTWLSEREQRAWQACRDLSRREEWLLGRWLAKRCLAHADEALCDVEILPQTVAGLASRPAVYRAGVRQACALSLSHGANGVALAYCETACRLGIDLVAHVAPSQGFVRLWFNEQEQAWLQASEDATLAALAWGAKEAAYKALQQGERFAPRQFTIEPITTQLWRCHYHHECPTTIHVHLRPMSPRATLVLAVDQPQTHAWEHHSTLESCTLLLSEVAL